MYKYIFVILLCCNACMVGPDYQVADMQLADSFEHQQDTNALTTKKDADLLQTLWWQHFDDPMINTLMERLIQQNQDILIALERVNEARAIAGEGRLGLMPDSQLSGGYVEGVFGTARNPFFQNNDRDFQAYSVTAETSWELDLFGRVRREIERREANAAAQAAALHEAIIIAQSELLLNYLELRSAQTEKKVLKKNAKLLGESLSLTEARFEAGATSELDVTRTRSLLLQTRASLPLVRQKIEQAIQAIAVLLGVQARDLPTGLKESAAIPQYKGSVHLLNPAELLQERPDIRRAEQELKASNAEIGYETAEFFPKVQLVGSFGFEARQFGDLGANNSDAYAYGPSITWRILNFRRIMRRVDAADARTRQAAHRYQQVVLTALAEVENMLTAFRHERRRFTQLQSATEASQTAAELSREQYTIGEVAFLDVLQAERTKLELEQQLVQSQATVQKSYVRLYKAFGGGWQALKILTND